MRHAAGKHRQRFHLLGMLQFFVKYPLFLFRLFDFRNITENRETANNIAAVIDMRLPRHQHIPPTAVLPAYDRLITAFSFLMGIGKFARHFAVMFFRHDFPQRHPGQFLRLIAEYLAGGPVGKKHIHL